MDTQGRPIHITLTPGQRHEASVAEDLIPVARGKHFIGDTGYDATRIRVAARKAGMTPVIKAAPQRKRKPRLKKELYKKRYIVECTFHSLKRFRAVATRYEKTARNYLALIHVVASSLWL